MEKKCYGEKNLGTHSELDEFAYKLTSWTAVLDDALNMYVIVFLGPWMWHWCSTMKVSGLWE